MGNLLKQQSAFTPYLPVLLWLLFIGSFLVHNIDPFNAYDTLDTPLFLRTSLFCLALFSNMVITVKELTQFSLIDADDFDFILFAIGLYTLLITIVQLSVSFVLFVGIKTSFLLFGSLAALLSLYLVRQKKS